MRNEKITPLYERLSRDDELQGESNSIIARTFKSSLLQRWSAHLWQNEMTKVRKFHIMSCIAIY